MGSSQCCHLRGSGFLGFPFFCLFIPFLLFWYAPPPPLCHQLEVCNSAMTIASCATYVSETYATNQGVVSGAVESSVNTNAYRGVDVVFVIVFAALFVARR